MIRLKHGLNVSLWELIEIATTIKDIARHTGLSIATISKYLNGGNVLDENRILINNAIKKFDYKVNEIARGLKTSKTMTIGILIQNLENIFSTSIVSNVENILLRNGYSTIICDYKEDPLLEREKINFLINKMVDGLIMLPLESDSKQINSITEKNIPVVLIDRLIKDAKCDSVLVDNLNASYNAVEQLIARGHKKIGIICGPEYIYTTQERLKGYIRVHEDYAMKVNRNLIKFGDYQIQGGYDLLCEFLEQENKPTAVFITNYEMTLGAVIAINERNINIPEELSIIGFDNLQMAKVVKPSLSLIVQPMEEIGEMAANILLKRLKGDMGNFPEVIRLKTKIHIKDSVKNYCK